MEQRKKKTPFEKKNPSSHHAWIEHKKIRNQKQYEKRIICESCRRDSKNHHLHCREKNN